jgi:hypothetical protein
VGRCIDFFPALAALQSADFTALLGLKGRFAAESVAGSPSRAKK